jgi:hypothetical protein
MNKSDDLPSDDELSAIHPESPENLANQSHDHAKFIFVPHYLPVFNPH